MKFSVGAITVLSLLASLALSQNEDSFFPVAIDGDLPSCNRINLPPRCPANENKIQVLNAMFTIQPSTDGKITVSSFPADIILVNQTNPNELNLEWLPYTSSSLGGGGVIISCPPNQMKTVSVGLSSIAQIRDGFTSVENIEVSSSANLQATFTSLNSNTLKLTLATSGSATIISNQAADEVSVSTSGNLALQADTRKVSVFTSGRLSMKGNAESGNIDTSAFATIGGDITGDMSVSTSGILVVGGDITGSIGASSSGIVQASSCDNVSVQTSGKCTEANVGPLSISVEDLPLTLLTSRTYHCDNGSFIATFTGTTGPSSGPSKRPSSSSAPSKRPSSSSSPSKRPSSSSSSAPSKRPSSSSGAFGKTDQHLSVAVETSFIALAIMFLS